ncbi:hypothetical protein GCM10009734_64170 [Nonomuraea bangladeshensis]
MPPEATQGAGAERQPPLASPRRSRVVTCLAAAAVTLVAAAGGMAALIAVATITATPALFMIAGVGAFLVIGYSGAAVVAAWRVPPERRRAARWTVFAAGSLLPGAVFAWAVSTPQPVPPSSVSVPGAMTVQVSTGSRLTVIKLPVRAAASRPPIIVVHGGPGVPELRDNAEAFAFLADQGFDVYLYAQLGADGSARLADPRGYTRERAVADLEGLRSRLGLDKVTLIGHSYGGEIAARYLAAHPDRVSKLVLTSPGAADPDDHSGDLVSSRLDSDQKVRLYARLLAPRSLLSYLLLQVNPRAAHAFLPDAEADAVNDMVVELSEPALYCRGATLPDRPPVRGTGFYAMQYPQSATAPPPSDPRPALAGLPTPTLIVKDSCDYLSWRSAVTYRDLLPNSRLIYLVGAGHNVYQGGHAMVPKAITAFLADRPLPLPPYTADTPPADYEGPP